MFSLGFRLWPILLLRFDDSIEKARKLTRPRIIKTHLPFDLLPRQLLDKKPKIVFVSRNVRDVCVSFYFHCRNLEGFTGDFQMWCDLFLSGYTLYYSPLDKFLESYYGANYPKDKILFLKYEDLKKDLTCEIKKTASYLDLQLNEDVLPDLLEHLSFSNFKKESSLNKSQLTKRATENLHGDASEMSAFMRKGKVGDWKNYLTIDMLRRFEVLESKIFETTGVEYHLDWTHPVQSFFSIISNTCIFLALSFYLITFCMQMIT